MICYKPDAAVACICADTSSETMRDWRRLIGDEYKSLWCTQCTGGRDIAGVWAHWERSDGFTVCGESHSPECFPLPKTSGPHSTRPEEGA